MTTERGISLVIPCTQEGWITRMALTRPCKCDKPAICGACLGSGHLITDEGRAILDLILLAHDWGLNE